MNRKVATFCNHEPSFLQTKHKPQHQQEIRTFASGDLSQNGAAYVSVELLNAKDVVLIVLGFAPHLEVANIVSRLL